MNPVKFITLIICALIFAKAHAQKVFSVDRQYQADLKVFVVDHEYQADLIVYKTDKDYKAKRNENKGIWFFTSREYQAIRQEGFLRRA